MNISPINAQHPNTQFKSAFPVVHWVAETNGSYARISNLDTVKKLQGKMVRILNKPLGESKKVMHPTEQNLRAYLGECDVAYRLKATVRSFYNRISSSLQGQGAVSYLITGEDVGKFNDLCAKDIGRAKRDGIQSNETKEAIRVYNRHGLNFVNNSDRQICDRQGVAYVLHTKFEIVRNKLGKIKDYRFVDARFLPANRGK